MRRLSAIPGACSQPPHDFLHVHRSRIVLTLRRDPPNGALRCLEGRVPLIEPHSMGSASGSPPLEGPMLGGKHLQFLATKVVPPRCQGLIERPRLLGLTSQLSGK